MAAGAADTAGVVEDELPARDLEANSSRTAAWIMAFRLSSDRVMVFAPESLDVEVEAVDPAVDIERLDRQKD